MDKNLYLITIRDGYDVSVCLSNDYKKAIDKIIETHKKYCEHRGHNYYLIDGEKTNIDIDCKKCEFLLSHIGENKGNMYKRKYCDNCLKKDITKCENCYYFYADDDDNYIREFCDDCIFNYCNCENFCYRCPIKKINEYDEFLPCVCANNRLYRYDQNCNDEKTNHFCSVSIIKNKNDIFYETFH